MISAYGRLSLSEYCGANCTVAIPRVIAFDYQSVTYLIWIPESWSAISVPCSILLRALFGVKQEAIVECKCLKHKAAGTRLQERKEALCCVLSLSTP